MQEMQEQIKIPEGMTADEMKAAIAQHIIGPRSERDRAVIWAYMNGNHTYESLAEEFQISVSTVQRIIERGRGILYE